jgi:zinc protease
MIFLSLMLACPKQVEPVVDMAPPVPTVDRSKPGPLESSNFTLPVIQTGTLSNGMKVVVVENHELPVVQVRAVFNTGSWTDKAKHEGLASVSMDMLNEGAGDRDGKQISADLKALASSVSSNASSDSATVRADSLKKNLEPTLDIWAEVLLEPTFPKSEWTRIQKQRILDLEAARTDPDSMAWIVTDRLIYGSAYEGRTTTETTLKAISTKDMKAWYQTHLVPSNGTLLVGGDITLAEIQPLLEARLGSVAPGKAAVLPEIETIQPTQTTIYLVDKPGAAQSMVKAVRFVPARDQPEYWDLMVGNSAWGGMFMARLNMNLREDKGYTYGARSGIYNNQAGALWVASSSVQSEVTAPAMSELFAELAQVQAERPLTVDEVEYAKSNRVLGYPGSFETVDYLVGSRSTVWRYGLPENWEEMYIPGVQGVTPEKAQSTFVEQVASQPMVVTVVGDLASIKAPIVALGYPVVVLDLDGNVVEDN